MLTNYIREPDGTIRREPNTLAWAAWFEEPANRRIAETFVGNVRVSTVFLGIDHNFSPDDPMPILFESMVFGGPHDETQERYYTEEEARLGHTDLVRLVRERK